MLPQQPLWSAYKKHSHLTSRLSTKERRADRQTTPHTPPSTPLICGSRSGLITRTSSVLVINFVMVLLQYLLMIPPRSHLHQLESKYLKLNCNPQKKILTVTSAAKWTSSIKRAPNHRARLIFAFSTLANTMNMMLVFRRELRSSTTSRLT